MFDKGLINHLIVKKKESELAKVIYPTLINVKAISSLEASESSKHEIFEEISDLISKLAEKIL